LLLKSNNLSKSYNAFFACRKGNMSATNSFSVAAVVQAVVVEVGLVVLVMRYSSGVAVLGNEATIACSRWATFTCT